MSDEATLTLNERVTRLVRHLLLAGEHRRAAILLVVYRSEFVRVEAEQRLLAELAETGEEVVKVRVVADQPTADIPTYLAQHPASGRAIFLIYDVGQGGSNTLQFLNYRRELLVESQQRLVLWLTEGEFAEVARQAPDFFSFRGRSLEFLEPANLSQINNLITSLLLPISPYTKIDPSLLQNLLTELPVDEQFNTQRAEILNLLSKQYSNEPQRALAFALEAYKLAPHDPVLSISILNNLGQQHRLQSELEPALAYHQEALNLAYHLEESQWLAQTNWHLAEDYRFQGDYELAHSHALQAWQFWQETDAEPERWRGAVANTLGLIAVNKKDYKMAEIYFEEARATHLHLNLPVEVGRNLLNLGWVAMAQKELERARVYYEMALELVGDNTADKIPILNNIGALYVNQEQYQQALQTFYEAKHLLTQTTSQPLRQAEVTHNIAYALFKLERWEESMAVGREAAVYWEAIARPRQLSSLLSILARASAALGERKEALASYDRALALVQDLPDQQEWGQTLQEWRHYLIEEGMPDTLNL